MIHHLSMRIATTRRILIYDRLNASGLTVNLQLMSRRKQRRRLPAILLDLPAHVVVALEVTVGPDAITDTPGGRGSRRAVAGAMTVLNTRHPRRMTTCRDWRSVLLSTVSPRRIVF